MSDPLDTLFWRDEILQIMFWLRGEGIGETVATRDMTPLLNTEEPLVQYHLERLVDEGYVLRLAGAPYRYQLTDLGVKEGGRRFQDEFAGLTGQAHMECNDPNCACKTLGPGACGTKGQQMIWRV